MAKNMKRIHKAHIYRGIVILPADFNASGIRWTASLHDGLPLRTDTLEGIKAMIRERLEHSNA